MKKPELYKKTVDILVNAYMNDTLEHGSCMKCAIGNLIAANRGYTFDKNGGWSSGESPEWPAIHVVSNGKQTSFPHEFDITEGLEQIKSTGYTPEQTAKIEWAFEMADEGNSDDEWMFNGLMVVIDVLDEIHENTDKTITESAKSKFVKA